MNQPTWLPVRTHVRDNVRPAFRLASGIGLLLLGLTLGLPACRPAAANRPAASPSPVASPAAARAGAAAPPPTRTPEPTVTPVPARAPSPAPSPRIVVPPGPSLTARLHHQAATTDIRHAFARRLAEIAADRTRGRLKLEITPAGQVQAEAGELTALADNQIQLALPRTALLAARDPVWSVLDLPLLLTPSRAAELNRSAAASRLWETVRPQGIEGLALIDLRDPVILYTREKPIQTVGDLRGLRVRTYLTDPDLHDQWLGLFGARAVAIPAAEVYAALQRNQIDAVLTTISGAADLRLAELARYANLIPVGSVPMTLVAGRRWLNALPVEIRRALLEEIVPAAVAEAEAEAERNVAERRQRLTTEGLIFALPPPDTIDLLASLTERDFYPRYAPIHGADLIREIQALP